MKERSEELYYIFVFICAPDCPMDVCAIYPELLFNKDEKAKFDDGYYSFRISKWSYGKFPKYNETEPYGEK